MSSSQVKMLEAALALREALNNKINEELQTQKVLYRLEFKFPKSTPKSLRNWKLVGGAMGSGVLLPCFSLLIFSLSGINIRTWTSMVGIVLMFVIIFVAFYLMMGGIMKMYTRIERDNSIVHITEKRFVLNYTNAAGMELKDANDRKAEPERQFYPWAISDIRSFNIGFGNFIVSDWQERKDLVVLKMVCMSDVFKNSKNSSGFFFPRAELRGFISMLVSLNKNIQLGKDLRKMVFL